MRKKLDTAEKRSNIIGIKVKQETRDQLEYIADREDTPLSSHINIVLQEYINTYFKHSHIDWNTLPEEEKYPKKKGGR